MAQCRSHISSFGESDESISIGRWTSVQSTACSRVVRISGCNAGYTMFRGYVKGTGYSLHSTVSPSLPVPASPCAITFQLESTNSNPKACLLITFISSSIEGFSRFRKFQENPRIISFIMFVRRCELNNSGPNVRIFKKFYISGFQ